MDCLSSGFSDIDRSSDPTFFASCLSMLNSMSYFRDYKRKSIDLMGARTGSKILEVGCGLGFDAIALSRIVGSSGRVVAVDMSLTMLKAAKSRAKDLDIAIEFMLADAAKTGGRIVAYEPDWGTFTIGSRNRQVTRKMVDLWCDTFRSGWIGRYLYDHFMKLELDDILICPSTLVVTDFDIAERVFDLSKNTERALDLGLVSSSEAEEWLRELMDDNSRGAFFCSYTGFMVAGRKP